ncbi:MAG: GtrA family protein [bacterium]
MKQFTGREHGPFVQVVKYGISGGLATAVHIALFSVMAWIVFPALTERELVAKLFHLQLPVLSDAVRARNAALDNFVAFLFSNFTAYLLNILWVFKRGRHHWLMEIGLFYAVSGLSMLIGTTLQTWMIASFGLTTTVSFGANLVTAMLINFAMRKFVIFKG